MAVAGKSDKRAARCGIDRQGAFLLVLIGFVGCVFGPSTSFDFVWDDTVLLLDRDAYANFDLRQIFFSLANGVEYLPVRDLSYALDHAIGGENPFGFHLTNLVLHGACAAFVYGTTALLTAFLFSGPRTLPAKKTSEVALLTALLFSIHPIQAEVVSFVSCRNVLLSGLFAFMSCFFFLQFLIGHGRYPRRSYVASFACCLFAIFSKATASALPLLLLFLAMFDGRPWRRTFLRLAPFLALSGASVVLFETISSQTGMIDPDRAIVFGSSSFAVRLAVALQIPFFYLAKLAFPSGLSALYDTAFANDPADPWVLFGVFATAASLVLGFRMRRRFPVLLFAVGWFLLALLPVLNFFATSPVVADRYVHLASYGFFFLIAATLILALPGLSTLAIRTVAATAVVTLSILAFQRSRVWESEETLWQNTIRVSPNAWKAYYNLGAYHFARREYEQAFLRFEQLAERRQSDGTIRIFKAQYALQQGNASTAIELLEGMLTEEESTERMPLLLGRAYERIGNTPKAIENYAEAVRRSDRLGDEEVRVARQRLQSLQAQQSSRLEGQRRAVSENPSNLKARSALAVACDRAGLYDEALHHYLELSQRGGDHWSLHYNLGNLYRKLERYEQAARSYEKSASLNPNHAPTHNNLGVTLKKLHAYDRAIRAFETAIELDPDFGSPAFNLATLYFRRGDAENARRAFDRIERSFPELGGRVKPYRDALR